MFTAAVMVGGSRAESTASAGGARAVAPVVAEHAPSSRDGARALCPHWLVGQWR